MNDVEESLSWLERERILSRALLMLTTAVFAAAKIITPWGLFDVVAVSIFAALAFMAVRAHKRVEGQQRSGHGIAPKNIFAATALDVIAVVVIGAFITWSSVGFSGVLHRVAMLLGALAVGLASFRGYLAYFRVWRRIRDRLPPLLEYSWGDLLDEEGPFSSRAPKGPSKSTPDKDPEESIFRKARKRRKVRR